MTTDALHASSNTTAQRPWQKTLADQVPALVLIALCIFSGLMSDRFISSANITNILLQASVRGV